MNETKYLTHTHTQLTENILILGNSMKVFAGMLDKGYENKTILFIISKIANTINNLSQVIVEIPIKKSDYLENIDHAKTSKL